MANNSHVQSKCPFCGSSIKRSRRWLRIVRNLARYAILYATLNGGRGNGQ